MEFSDKVDPAYLMSYMPLEQATSLITQQVIDLVAMVATLKDVTEESNS